MGEIKKCFACNNAILMIDGRTWCSITFQPDNCNGKDYIKGFPKLYKPEKVDRKEMVNKKPIKTVATKITKVKTIVKKEQKQNRLF